MTYKLITQNINIMPYSNNLSWGDSDNTIGYEVSFDSVKNLNYCQVVSLYNDNGEQIRGIVRDKKEVSENKWSYVIQDYGFYLNNKKVIQFYGDTATDCIRKLVGDNYLVDNICEIPTPITKIYINSSMAEIIKDILSIAEQDQGIHYVYNIVGNTFNVYKAADLRIVPNMLVGEFNIDGTIKDMKNTIQIVSNDNENNTVFASAADTSKYEWYGVLSDTIPVDADNVAQSLNIAKNKLYEVNRISQTTTIPIILLDEKCEVRADRLIYFHNKKLTGFYRIKSAKHSLIDGVHKCDVEIYLDIQHNTITETTEDINAINAFIEAAKNNNSSSSGSSKSEKAKGVGNRIVEYAKQFMGTPYVWGGTTPSGFDCSGFTQYCYNHFGISIPRVSEDQINCGKKTKNPKIGDLFFPHTGHVGIYVGNGQVIHSPKTGDVIKISNAWGRDSGYPIYVHVEGV